MPENDLQKIEYAAIQIRGHILHRVSELEMLIDTYIASHFTSTENKGVELITLILSPRVTFENKIQIFYYLVEQYNSKFKETYPKYNADLGRIRDERNIIAHYQIQTSVEALDKFKKDRVVYFVKLRPSPKKEVHNRLGLIEYTQEKVTSIVALIYDYTEAIQQVLKNK